MVMGRVVVTVVVETECLVGAFGLVAEGLATEDPVADERERW